MLLPLVLAAAGFVAPGGTATAVATPDRAGARPAALVVRLTYEMQCGYPGPGPVVLRLPRAERMPARLARGAVLVDGKPAVGVSVAGHVVTVQLAPPPEVLCMSIGTGTLTLAFTHAAGLGNPARPGSYPLAARRGKLAFAAAVRIRGR